MSAPGDQARASVRVGLPRELAFRVFTEEIDRWWRRGVAHRVMKGDGSVLCLEGFVGGRLFESFEGARGPRVVQTGTVTAWEPPARFVFEWRAVNFAEGEKTEVEVTFEPTSSGTVVTVTHRGWGAIRADHPVRHGQDVRAFLARLGGWWGGLLTSLREHAAARSPDT